MTMMTRSRSLALNGGRNPAARRNGILEALPADVYETLLPDLEPVHLRPGVHLDEARGIGEHAYFPTQGLVSLVYASEGGKCTELASVGAEGMLSVSAFLPGAGKQQALVLTPGFAYRLPTRRLRAQFDECGALHELLLAYAGSLMLEISLTAVCNRHHPLEKQLCRWLLHGFDRAGDELPVTQEQIAYLLGVRRQSVSETLGRLEEQGMISRSRGVIVATHRAGLAGHACECYEVLSAIRLAPPAGLPRRAAG